MHVQASHVWQPPVIAARGAETPVSQRGGAGGAYARLAAVASLRYRRVVVKLSGRAFAGAAPFGLDSTALGLRRRPADRRARTRRRGGGRRGRRQLLPWQCRRRVGHRAGRGRQHRDARHRHERHPSARRAQASRPRRCPADDRVADPVHGRAVHPPARAVAPGARPARPARLGIGQPYVTTDYPAVQRAIELRADAILLAKHGTDGIYDRDPRKEAGALPLRQPRLQGRARTRPPGDGPGRDRAGSRLRATAARLRLRRARRNLGDLLGENRGTYISP